MSKCVAIVVLAAFTCFSNAAPVANDDNNMMPGLPSFDVMRNFHGFSMPKFDTMKHLTPADIINAKPQDGGTYHGTSHSASSSMKTVNGKVVEEHSGGSFVDNDNGVVDKGTFST